MTRHLDVAATADGVYTNAFDAPEYLQILESESRLLLIAADGHRRGDEVAFCPGWTVRDLVTHVGWVYRWVSVIVGEARIELPNKEESQGLHDPHPDDDSGVMARLSTAATLVLDTLRRAPQDLTCWTTWATSSNPRDFWVRRMVHEALIHRVDAQNAGGGCGVRGIDLPLPVTLDGIDEMMVGFAGRYAKRLRHRQAATLALRTTETGHRWWVRISSEAPEFGRGRPPHEADTLIQGPAGEILLWLWNRRALQGLEVVGESHLPDTWSREAHL
jgi:uncharacterized protein (TIGR03083 family)